MRVLYLTNIHNPYRDKFFEQLGHKVDLTVLFEERSVAHRDASWFADTQASSYKEDFLPEGESRLYSKYMLGMLNGWDAVIVGCYNTPRQMAAISYMRRKGIPYIVNSDGMVFASSNPFKELFKRRVLRGATAYLVAGEACEESLIQIAGPCEKVQAYHFTSLTEEEVRERSAGEVCRDNNVILCVGRYEEYKGLDVLLDAAAYFPKKHFRIIGLGRKKEAFDELVVSKGLNNVETIAFMNPSELKLEYAKVGLFVLPSRQECWALVINEAAAAGCPIVSTWGVGAGIEFLSESYPQLLAKPGDMGSLCKAIESALKMAPKDKKKYSDYLKTRSSRYSIEECVRAHVALLESLG